MLLTTAIGVWPDHFHHLRTHGHGPNNIGQTTLLNQKIPLNPASMCVNRVR